MMDRGYFFRGSFYPETCAEIKVMFDKFNVMLENALGENIKDVDTLCPQALIVPHAGYVYSGFTANIAYRALSKNPNIKKALIIGPSHHHYFEGISVGKFDAYDLKNISLAADSALRDALFADFRVTFEPNAHKEHSTEVQFPFLSYYFGEKVEILEIVYGKCDIGELEKIIKYALTLADTALIISTDLSHFLDEANANKRDNICLAGIDKEDLRFLESCDACGIYGVKAMVKSAHELGMTHKILDYRTSSWASGDKSRVVGYTSVAYMRD